MKTPILSLFFFFLTFFVFFAGGDFQNKCSKYFQRRFAYKADSYRWIHRASNLYVDDMPADGLPYYAQLKAQFLAGNSKFDPPPPPIYFSLVHKIFHPDEDGFKVAEEMYQTGADYPFYCKEPPEEARQKYSQFTQLIWRSTKKIAFGCDDNQKTGERHSAIITWEEPGNQKGDYTNNVLPHEGCNVGHWGYRGEAVFNKTKTADAAAES